MSRNPDGTFSSLAAPLSNACLPPTDLTIAQFILDTAHPLRPIRQADSPWFIEDETGRGVGYEEVRARTWGLANAIRGRWTDIGELTWHSMVLFLPQRISLSFQLRTMSVSVPEVV
jgi:hypothetical protein